MSLYKWRLALNLLYSLIAWHILYIYEGKYMTLDISLSMSVFGISMLSVESRSVLGHLVSWTIYDPL